MKRTKNRNWDDDYDKIKSPRREEKDRLDKHKNSVYDLIEDDDEVYDDYEYEDDYYER